jgi:hypothetical protein
VQKFGPKEACAEVCGLGLCAIPYFRNALRGIFKGGCELFCNLVPVHEIPRQAPPSTIFLRISWA